MIRKTLYPFTISIVLLLTVIIINSISFSKMEAYAGSVDHTRDVISSFIRLSGLLRSAETYSPNYSKFANATYYKMLKDDALAIPKEIAHIKYLTRDNPKQIKLLDTLGKLVDAQLPALMQKNIGEIIQSGEGWRLEKFWRIQIFINEGIEHEKFLLAHRKDILNSSTQQTRTLTTIFSIIALCIITVTFVWNLVLTRKRKWLEGFLESVLNTSQNGIVNFKAVRKQGKIIDFKIEFANAALGRLLSVNPDAIMGKRLSSIRSYIAETDTFKRYTEIVETGEQQQFETLYQQDDIQRWFYVMLVKLEDGLTASFHDISDVKKYEEELKKNIKQLERSNKELEEYAYVASHDLQEPLRKIMTYSNLLNNSQTTLTDKGKDYINKITTSSQRMSFLIKDILNFSALDREQSFTETNMDEIVGNVLEDLELLITQKEAVIHSDKLPVIEAIPLQIHQLFYNLISNALKFSRPGIKPAVYVKSRQLQPGEIEKYGGVNKHVAHVELSVSDNGIGFNQKFADQIFGLFKRLNDKKEFSGSGIGLALCKKVALNHNGEIFATGKEGEGSAFYIILPVKHNNQ